MTDTVIIKGGEQPFIGLMPGANIWAQTFVANASIASSLTFFADIAGGTGGDVTLRIELVDVDADGAPTNHILFLSAPITVNYLSGENLDYEDAGEFRSVSLGLGDTALQTGHHYAVLFQYVSGDGFISFSANSSNSYLDGQVWLKFDESDADWTGPLTDFDIAMTLAYVGGQASANVSSMSAVVDNNATHIGAGHLITITMTTSAPVIVTGTPTLQLNNNLVATYTFGSATDTLQFTYVVGIGDNVAHLQVTGLNLPSGAHITDSNNNNLAGPFTGDLGIQVDTTTVSPTSVLHEILGLYSALYDRAADFSGVSYWVGVVGQQPDAAGVTVANADNTAISVSDATILGQLFVTTQSGYFNSIYGSLNDSEFITALYANIGGNTIGIAPGLTYWGGLLHAAEAAGQSLQAARAGIVGLIVKAMIDYDINVRAPGYTDAEWLAAEQRQETIDNKIAVSLAFSNASHQPGGGILESVMVTDAAFQAATRAIEGVTFDGTTASAAIGNILDAVSHQDLNEIQPVGLLHGGLIG
jgi:hypothetical protein